MSKPLNAEVSRLVSQAIRLPEAERIAWLKQACQGNPQLLAAASEELLQASAETIDSNRLSKPTQGQQVRGGPASEEQTVEAARLRSKCRGRVGFQTVKPKSFFAKLALRPNCDTQISSASTTWGVTGTASLSWQISSTV